MRRREFIGGVGVSAVLGAGGAWAQQQARMPVVGILRSTPADDAKAFMISFRQGLGEAGFVEGRNVAIDFRSADNVYDRLPILASDLARKKVDVIVATGAVSTALAAKAATTTIPIVFAIGSDPIETGIVSSLNRPAENITGVTLFSGALIAKKLELLREIIPTAAAIGFLVNPNNPNAASERREIQALAQTGGWELHVVNAGSDSDLDRALVLLERFRVDGFLHSSDVLFTSRYPQIVTFAALNKIPAIYSRRDAAAAGGLLSYGTRPTITFHAAGVYTGRILQGAKPADLPVQLPSTFELVLNLRTAKASGITIPTSILLRADEVIE
jgi:putative ABC transport system substrate-binding protein